jgi:RNA polymerase sigma-70 factor (ECF subfamily)
MSAMQLRQQQQQVQLRARRDSGVFLKSEVSVEQDVEAPVEREEQSGIHRLGSLCRTDVDDERALVEALIANDPSAWREFQRRYDRLVLRCITKITKRFAAVSQDDVREIYAQLLVSLLANGKAKLRAFDPARGSRFSSYIGMLAIHCAYDWLRAVRREPQREVLSEAAELTSDTPDPFEAAAQQERAEMAARVMEGFSERDRTFAALYFGEGMEPHEIARSMKISVKTVYSKKHKIQSKLEAIVARIRGQVAA